MKRNLYGIMTMAVLAGVLAGCGEAEAESGKGQPDERQETAAATVEEKKDTDADAAAAKEETPTETEQPTEAPAADPKVLYEAFLAGEASVSIKGNEVYPDGEYTLKDLIEARKANFVEFEMPYKPGEMNYGYIDCGVDGIPELVLAMTYDEDSEYGMQMTDNLIIKEIDGKLQLVTSLEEYYRTEVEINEYGYISYGGSSSAFSNTWVSSFVNADGEEVFLYTEELTMGLNAPVFPSDNLPQEVIAQLPESGETVYNYVEGGEMFELDAYFFQKDIDENAEDWMKAYDEYLMSGMYSFQAETGEDAVMDEEYLASCKAQGIKTPHLFSGTIRENLRYGRPDATDEQIWEALKLVSADQIVHRMEKGLDSDVGEGGGMLSTGEKQLLSFARALLADPRILVLDEATASIDTVTEKAIQEAISTVTKGRTSFVIAHRLSTIVEADIILLVQDGKIIERAAIRN